MTRSTDKIREIVEGEGYIFIEEYIKKDFLNRTIRKVVISDNIGYKYDVLFSHLKDKRGFSFVDKTNQFSLYNISLWIKLNTDNFTLIENRNTKYEGNTQKLKFFCSVCNDEFYMSWGNIHKHRGCPVCHGLQVGLYHSVRSIMPEICDEWDIENKVQPEDVTIGSSKTYIDWTCRDCSHKWNTTVASRCFSGTGCPNCAGQIVNDENRLTLNFPELMKDWDYDKNIGINPNDLMFGSNKKVWWLCNSCHYSWKSPIGDRSSGRGCGRCSGRFPSDKNRLSILFPEVCKEWNYEKNYPMTPDDFSFGSGKYAWWTCKKCKKDSYTIIATKTTRGGGCKYCNESQGEKELFSILSSFGLKLHKDFDREHKIPDCKNILPLPFDFVIYKKSTKNKILFLIEFQGVQHYEPIKHFGGKAGFKKVQYRDKIKQDYCYNKNIPLLIIPYTEFDNIETILINTFNELEGDRQ